MTEQIVCTNCGESFEMALPTIIEADSGKYIKVNSGKNVAYCPTAGGCRAVCPKCDMLLDQIWETD